MEPPWGLNKKPGEKHQCPTFGSSSRIGNVLIHPAGGWFVLGISMSSLLAAETPAGDQEGQPPGVKHFDWACVMVFAHQWDCDAKIHQEEVLTAQIKCLILKSQTFNPAFMFPYNF